MEKLNRTMKRRICHAAQCQSPQKLACIESASTANEAEVSLPLPVHEDEGTLSKEWPFETDFGDHFETPRRAFKDIKPVRWSLSSS